MTGVIRRNVPIGCVQCGNLGTCTCGIAKRYHAQCRFRVAAQCPVELECEHGLQACPVCDPCTCGAGGDVGVR